MRAFDQTFFGDAFLQLQICYIQIWRYVLSNFIYRVKYFILSPSSTQEMVNWILFGECKGFKSTLKTIFFSFCVLYSLRLQRQNMEQDKF